MDKRKTTKRKAVKKTKASPKRKPKRLRAPDSVTGFTPKHFRVIHAGLRNAGLSGFRIQSLVLKPDAAADVESSCRAVPDGRGGYTIEC